MLRAYVRTYSAILCLDITDREIGLAVAESASPGTEVHKLNPLSYHKAADTVKNRQQLKETVYDKLDEIVQDNNVGGIVVAWPTVSGGRAGGSCGKVLHLLDYIAGKLILLLFLEFYFGSTYYRIDFYVWDKSSILFSPLYSFFLLEFVLYVCMYVCRS